MSTLPDQLEFQELDVVCPHCGARCSREAGLLRRDRALDCDACGRHFSLDPDLLACALRDLAVDAESEGDRSQTLSRLN